MIAIDQSTSATKALLFDSRCQLRNRVSVSHSQYYPQPGWVEHDPEEIYANTVSAIKNLVPADATGRDAQYSLAITNQRETVVVWNATTGRPIYNAIVWQCQRGAEICRRLKDAGHEEKVKERSGLLIDPYFSASGVKWLLDNVEDARAEAEKGNLRMGTIDSWLIWKLTCGRTHATDYTNASRTLLFNIHTLDWDDELLKMFGVPRSMMPKALPCDSVFGSTTVEGLFPDGIEIAGVLGDSHGALAGQMCFKAGMGKATYGTGSSVMVNIGERPVQAADGLVTSVGFAAKGKVFYAFEGNIHCTGATIKWLAEQLQIIGTPAEAEAVATSVADTNGVYFVPAFAGLGAPWWMPSAKAIICGMTLGTSRAHIVRAALESIAFQVKDLVDLMTTQAGISLREMRVDGGPTNNEFLMRFQADMLDSRINRSDVDDASALGATIMNGLARGLWGSLEEVAQLREKNDMIEPDMPADQRDRLYQGWLNAVALVNSKKPE